MTSVHKNREIYVYIDALFFPIKSVCLAENFRAIA